METFIEAKKLTENPDYHEQREKSLSELTDDMIDDPIIDIIKSFNSLPHSFTLQSCYGHFVHGGQKKAHNTDPLSSKRPDSKVEYRIAYIAFCIENNGTGEQFLKALEEIPGVAPEYIQFGSAEWFWERQINSYVLQVEPDKFKHQDTALIDYEEALTIEKIRNEFFIRLQALTHLETRSA